eukprot:2515879-Alexandrium_andersonii.AAC.1
MLGERRSPSPAESLTSPSGPSARPAESAWRRPTDRGQHGRQGFLHQARRGPESRGRWLSRVFNGPPAPIWAHETRCDMWVTTRATGLGRA